MTKRSRYTHNDYSDWEAYQETRTVETGPKRLRRNKIDGILGGVCSGLGDHFGIDHIIVRILYVLSIFLGLPIFIYFVLWVFIPSDKRAPYIREYREARRARREQPEAPVRTASFRDVKSKFRSLEGRLQDLERSITSKEWKLNREFRDLEG